MKQSLMALTLLLLLASCSSGEPAPVKPELGTAAKINLDVLSITVVDHSGAPMASSPYNTNNFRPTIANAIRTWVANKLVAVGSTGEAIVVIQDASLSSQALSYTEDWFKRQQASKYVGHASVEIDVNGREGHGVATAESSRFETLAEKPSVIERQNAYYTVLNGLMEDIDTNLNNSIQEHLNAFLITAPILDNNQPSAPRMPSVSPY